MQGMQPLDHVGQLQPYLCCSYHETLSGGVLCLAKEKAYETSCAAEQHVMGSLPHPLTRLVVHPCGDIPWSSEDNQAQAQQRGTLHVIPQPTVADQARSL